MCSAAASSANAFRKISCTHLANASPGLKECLTHLSYAKVYHSCMLQDCLLYPIYKKSKKREIPFPVVFCHPGIHMDPLSKVSADARKDQFFNRQNAGWQLKQFTSVYVQWSKRLHHVLKIEWIGKPIRVQHIKALAPVSSSPFSLIFSTLSYLIGIARTKAQASGHKTMFGLVVA